MPLLRYRAKKLATLFSVTTDKRSKISGIEHLITEGIHGSTLEIKLLDQMGLYFSALEIGHLITGEIHGSTLATKHLARMVRFVSALGTKFFAISNGLN